jgi:hypothetical protein
VLCDCLNQNIQNSLLAFLLTAFVLRPEVGLRSQDPQREIEGGMSSLTLSGAMLEMVKTCPIDETKAFVVWMNQYLVARRDFD